MKGLTLKGFVCFVVLVSSISVMADTLIYNNSSYTGSVFPPGYYNEIFDYGMCDGGLVSKITFRYQADYTTSNVYVRFYRSIRTQYLETGYLVKSIHIKNLPATGNGYDDFTYVIPEEDRFELPSALIGCSIECSSSSTQFALASGESGQQNEMWRYISGWGWEQFWFGGSPWAGLYLKVYKGPRIEDVTCDIAGHKFNDANSNGVWDTGESGISRWEFYMDTNGDGSYQVSEPNVLTDPNGMYFFENIDAPATYTIREIMKDGWTQTLPGAGADNEYVIAVDPNTLYSGLDFGNTDQFIPSDIKLYGYIEMEDGIPVSGVRVETGLGSDFDVTDAQGYYEINVSAPFTGWLELTKERWQQNTWSQWHENRMTDYRQDFEILYLYGGGDGSEADPFQIQTAEQMNFIGCQTSHWDNHFVLMADIDLGNYTGMEYNIIGNNTGPLSYFSGTFDGNGHTISNFSYVLSNGMVRSGVGLFGYMGGLLGDNARITNLGIINPNISGDIYAGALLGNFDRGTVTNCWVQGGQVSGRQKVGGLVGYVGGTLETSYAKDGIVTCTYNAGGGLVGGNGGTIQNCYSSFSVNGIYNSTPLYEGVGGFVGSCMWGEISNCYSTGTVTRPEGVLGGFCSYNYECILTDCFWDTNTSHRPTSAGGAGVVGLETADMQTLQTYLDAGWDFATTWRMCDGFNYPRLRWEPRVTGDITCPDGVEINDLLVLVDEWLLQKQSADIAPNGGDGQVDLQDWAMLADAWMTTDAHPKWNAACDIAPENGDGEINMLDMTSMVDQWMLYSAQRADIAPVDAPDGKVDLLDFTVLADHWMEGVD
jgi:hypothetical protein